MRAVLMAILALAVTALAATTAVVFHNAGIFAMHQAGMAHWSARILDHDANHWAHLKAQAVRRARLYEDMLSDTHLRNGMVVNRNAEGKAIDVCDSLLFSSLRYVALRKLGWHEDADEAWLRLTQSKERGQWVRHPTCHRWLSRDMVVGVLAAFSTKPPGYEEHLRALIDYVGRHDGYVDNGPFYVSYLSPGLAALVRSLALDMGMAPAELPMVVRYGYSTLELDTLGGKRGYQSHLIALVAWIEQEIARHRPGEEGAPTIPNLPHELNPVLGAISGYRMDRDRLNWITYRLFAADPDNLFFRFLYLRSINALTLPARIRLMESLLAMPQFPENRLPTSCDRRADYLWQRDSREYYLQSRSPYCQTFNGIDFLWMVAALVED